MDQIHADSTGAPMHVLIRCNLSPVRGGGCEPEHGDPRRVARTSGGREEDRGISTGQAHGSRAGEPGAFTRPAGLPRDHPRDGRNLTGEKRATSGVLSAAPLSSGMSIRFLPFCCWETRMEVIVFPYEIFLLFITSPGREWSSILTETKFPGGQTATSANRLIKKLLQTTPAA